jgi:hypothetical protein
VTEIAIRRAAKTFQKQTLGGDLEHPLLFGTAATKIFLGLNKTLPRLQAFSIPMVICPVGRLRSDNLAAV